MDIKRAGHAAFSASIKCFLSSWHHEIPAHHRCDCQRFRLSHGSSRGLCEAAEGDLANRLLHLHNDARISEGQPSLQWNPDLAAAADVWARKLAKEGRMRHSSWDERKGTGENLWMGTAGFYTPDAMIGAFTREKRDFRPGTFPDVSKTGKWQDVGHYTQIIWPGTQQVGCAIAKGKGSEYLVCRYWPSGNFAGSKVG